MTCRAPTNATTCAGTPTGAQLTYDNEGRLSAWQNAPGSSPTSTTQNLYDGEGNRVLQQVTSGGSSTSTTYIGGVEEVAAGGIGGTITTTYYSAGGHLLAEGVNGAISYLATDGLGSATVALDGSGNATASTLYAPYGQARYTTGAMPGSRGFTGQHSDSTTGLDYYNARYYDAVAGQFTSADTVGAGGLNRYAYVHGNPETFTDPTGHMIVSGDGGAGGGTPTPPPSPPGGCGGNKSCSTAGGSGHPSDPCKKATIVCKPSVDPGYTYYYDKRGRCLDAYTCEHARTEAASALKSKGDSEDMWARILIIAGKLISAFAFAAAQQVSQAITEFAEAFAWIDEYFVPLANGLFGRDSWEAQLIEQVVEAVNGTITAISGFYGIAFLAGAVLTALEGPAGVVLKVVGILIGSAMELASAGGYWLLNQAIEDHDHADELYNTSTVAWCDGEGKGQCADGWSKAYHLSS